MNMYESVYFIMCRWPVYQCIMQNLSLGVYCWSTIYYNNHTINRSLTWHEWIAGCSIVYPECSKSHQWYTLYIMPLLVRCSEMLRRRPLGSPDNTLIITGLKLPGIGRGNLLGLIWFNIFAFLQKPISIIKLMLWIILYL